MKKRRIRITLKRSLIGQKPIHRKTIRALGLRKIGSVVEKQAQPSILGMAKKVSHLVDVEEVS
jgi:large subunit ribosomal protein L30